HVSSMTMTGPALTAELHGSISNHEMSCVVFPAYAANLNAIIAGGGQPAQSVKQIFDTGDGNGGNCAPDASCGAEVAGVPSNGHIEVCEVRGNSLVKNLF